MKGKSNTQPESPSRVIARPALGHLRAEAIWPRHRATAVVEFAVVLPLLLAIVLGIIEFGWIFTTTQTLNSAAREGCRTAVLTGATDDDIKAKVDKVMQGVGYKGYTSTLAHATLADPTEKVTVEYSYSPLTGKFFFTSDNITLKGVIAMRKEGM